MRALIKSRLLLPILLSLLVVHITYASNDKRDEEEKKKYIEWLEQNKKAQGYAKKLTSLVEIERDVKKSIDYIEKYSPFIKDDMNKALIEKKGADLYLLTGDIPKAQGMYQKSWESYPVEENTESLLLSSIMLAQMGEMEMAQKGIAKILEFDGIESVKFKATFLSGLILFAQGQTDEAIKSFQSIMKSLQNSSDVEMLPEVVYSLYSAYRVKNDLKKMKEYLSLLSEKYSTSIEYRIVQDTDNYMVIPQPISIMTFMKEKEDEGYYIQTGSFHVRENAEYMKKDLLKINFNVTVKEETVNDTAYYRVLVGPFRNISTAQSMLGKLKDNGFSGFITKKK